MGVRDVRRAILASLILLAVWIVLFRLSHWLIAADRGLDITDETMYLLSATSDSIWGFPFGNHTRPLLRVCGGDIACFRSTGFLIFFAVSLALTMSVQRALREDSHDRALLTRASQALLALGATLLFYTSFVSRTPSYNWVNAVGILIAAAAHVQLMSRRPELSRRLVYALEFAAAAGIFYSTPGKPSTPILLLFSYGVIRACSSTILESVLSVGRQLLAVTLLVAVSVTIGLWRSDFVSLFRHALSAPTPGGAAQTPLGAIRVLLEVPQTLPETAWTLALSPRFGLLLASLALTSWLRRRVPGRLADASFLGALLLAVSAVLYRVAKPESLFFGSDAVFRGCVALAITLGTVRAFSASAGWWSPRREKSIATQPWRDRVSLYVYLLALPAVFSFGSSNGFETMFGLFPLPALLVLIGLTATRDQLVGAATRITLVAFVVVIGTFARSTALEHPYRTAPIDSESERTEISDSALLVERQLHDLILAMQTDARDAGFEVGTGLVSLDWRWQSFTPLVLGATPPATMVTTHNVNLALFRHNAQRFANPGFLEEAWITVTPRQNIPEQAEEAVDSVIREFERLARRPFPEAYRCIGDYGTTQLWRPRSSHEVGDTTCPLKGPYPYDLNAGFKRPE